MKPITYWIQNEAVNQLVDQFGPHLEKLSPGTRRDLIACLANDSHYWAGELDDLDEAYPVVEHLTRNKKDLLIEAIAATLPRQSNPWIDGARRETAIEHALEPKK